MTPEERSSFDTLFHRIDLPGHYEVQSFYKKYKMSLAAYYVINNVLGWAALGLVMGLLYLPEVDPRSGMFLVLSSVGPQFHMLLIFTIVMAFVGLIVGVVLQFLIYIDEKYRRFHSIFRVCMIFFGLVVAAKITSQIGSEHAENWLYYVIAAVFGLFSYYILVILFGIACLPSLLFIKVSKSNFIKRWNVRFPARHPEWAGPTGVGFLYFNRNGSASLLTNQMGNKRLFVLDPEFRRNGRSGDAGYLKYSHEELPRALWEWEKRGGKTGGVAAQPLFEGQVIKNEEMVSVLAGSMAEAGFFMARSLDNDDGVVVTNPASGLPTTAGAGSPDVAGNAWGMNSMTCVNPASGLPTVAGVGSPDVAGNTWGANEVMGARAAPGLPPVAGARAPGVEGDIWE